MTSRAAELFSQLASLLLVPTLCVGTHAGDALRRGSPRFLPGEEHCQRCAFRVRQLKNRHPVIAVQTGRLGEPYSEEAGRPFIGNVRQIASTQPAARAEIAPAVTS